MDFSLFWELHWQAIIFKKTLLRWILYNMGPLNKKSGIVPVSPRLVLSSPRKSHCFFSLSPFLWSSTCDKVSGRCFPFTTTLLCLSELEAVTHKRRSGASRSDTKSRRSKYKITSIRPLLNITSSDRRLASQGADRQTDRQTLSPVSVSLLLSFSAVLPAVSPSHFPHKTQHLCWNCELVPLLVLLVKIYMART